MTDTGDARGTGKGGTLALLVLIVALFFGGIIVRHWIWP